MNVTRFFFLMQCHGRKLRMGLNMLIGKITVGFLIHDLYSRNINMYGLLINPLQLLYTYILTGVVYLDLVFRIRLIKFSSELTTKFSVIVKRMKQTSAKRCSLSSTSSLGTIPIHLGKLWPSLCSNFSKTNTTPRNGSFWSCRNWGLPITFTLSIPEGSTRHPHRVCQPWQLAPPIQMKFQNSSKKLRIASSVSVTRLQVLRSVKYTLISIAT